VTFCELDGFLQFIKMEIILVKLIISNAVGRFCTVPCSYTWLNDVKHGILLT
jgi:hypothetical protein